VAEDPILARTRLIDESDFRLVKLEIADGSVEHVLEVRDGQDAMGTERWRKFEVNGTAMRSLFKYLVRVADKDTL
jgi:hypothetical protein